jgi:CIC family chloride channel protein
MGALVAGVTHAPISAVLILFEMTDDYDVILPLMFASVISTAVCSHLLGESIYTMKLARKGVRVHEGQEQTVLARLRVAEAMKKSVPTILETLPFRRVVGLVTESHAQTFPVIDEAQRLTGLLTLDDVREALIVPELGDLVIAKEVATPVERSLTPEDNLLAAFEAFNRSNLHELPVVAADDRSRLLGMLARTDAMDAYNRALTGYQRKGIGPGD